jgi:hypothetical protein
VTIFLDNILIQFGTHCLFQINPWSDQNRAFRLCKSWSTPYGDCEYANKSIFIRIFTRIISNFQKSYILGIKWKKSKGEQIVCINLK